MIRKVPQEVINVLKVLNENNFKSYIVGGCVRDLILGIIPKDYDLCTDALPNQVKSLFNKVLLTGEKHGTVTVLINNMPIEVTTMRYDGNYMDNRRPDSVNFIKSLKEDVSRRDFTINSIAVDINGKIYDYFNGIKDLKNGVIKAVGNPDERFKEDALRMLRCIRFSCQLDFNIDGETEKSILNNNNLINNISKERIRDELCKILTTDYSDIGIHFLKIYGLLKHIIPEFENINPEFGNTNHFILKLLGLSNNNLNVRLACLFYSFDTDKIDIILRRLKFDNDTIKCIKILVSEYDEKNDFLDVINIKKFMSRVGDNLTDAINFKLAIITAKMYPDINKFKSFKEQIAKIKEEKQPIYIKDLAINGFDLINLGMKQGKEIGFALDKLLDKVIENPELNTKEQLLNIVNERKI